MEMMGFSTGAVARSDFRCALRAMGGLGAQVVELSALRMAELGPLVAAIPDLDLAGYDYVSVHAPSSFTAGEEAEVVDALRGVVERGWPVVVHPDTIHDHAPWAGFGSLLCVENMDKRKRGGRNVAELARVFDRLPDASLCFDMAHARQCDPSMTEAFAILSEFGGRLRQLHISEVDVASRHVRLTWSGTRAFLEIADMIPSDLPVVLESPVRPEEMEAELHEAMKAVGRAAVLQR
ncbi:MAG TPA: hypothetical protein VE913_07390 [Longimicrobium sp.]|nr:hypothetical protein [Longimicrobium sp.]